MITRDPGIAVVGLSVQNKIYTCSTGDVASGSAINGRVIDRLGLGTQRFFEICKPSLHIYTTVGTTGPDRFFQLDVKLQHGDSSAGGDMADFSTGQQPASRNFNTTAESTAYQNWSTAANFMAHQATYNVTAAKRFIRAVGILTKNGSSTSTAAGSVDYAYAFLGVAFEQPDQNVVPFSSTTTSTSTST